MTDKKNNTFSLILPQNVLTVAQTLHNAGFEVNAVGGCIRDSIMNRPVKDWDFTTNASPEQIQGLFEHTVYENDFGTVVIVFDDAKVESEKLIEVTPYRKEVGYSDNRRPDKVEFGCSLEEDLARRDFTINALAYNPVTEELFDLYSGLGDLQKGLIRAVGDPNRRFNEDALRLLRAARIATELGGTVEKKTAEAVKNNAEKLETIAIERVRDEFVKVLQSENPAQGVLLLTKLNLLSYIVPELLDGIGIEQNQSHKFDVFEHNVRTLEHAGNKGLSLALRLSALLHDISKPETREWTKEKGDWTFYTHEVVGARVAKKVLRRLRFSNETIGLVALLVRWHMFFSDTEKVTLAGVRRMVARVGEEHIWKLIDLRMCDRIGTGRPKEQPYRLRKYISLVEEVMREPITPGMLNINGKILMDNLSLQPGPHVGNILHILLEEVLENPEKNTAEALLKRAKELLQLSKKDLQRRGKRAKIKKMEEDGNQIKGIRRKYGVR